ncbi:MAG TPA: DUF3738 domain-containing protein [Bryobacteraceae bacterium]
MMRYILFERYGIDKNQRLRPVRSGIRLAKRNRGAKPGPSADAPDSIFSTVQQLGLRLTPEKGSEDFLVIDHAERPSPD